jgi:hypothetical protein
MMHRNRILLNRFIKGRIVGFYFAEACWDIPLPEIFFWQELSASFRALPQRRKNLCIPLDERSLP